MDSLSVYGTKRYSDDSALCLAAYHGGALLPDGGNFMIELKRGLLNYEGSTENGIKSKSRPGDSASRSISFIAEADETMIELNAAKEGMKIDVLSSKLGKWMPGSI